MPANSIARYNPATEAWSVLGVGTNAWVFEVAVLQGGDVIATENFYDATGANANRIARYNPATGARSVVGSQAIGWVYALAVLPGGDVITGGSFTNVGGVNANRIARYNPATGAWFALGTGINGHVSALTVLPGGDVLVGGLFTVAGGMAARNIARYNPLTGAWSALGSGTNNEVYTLAVLPGGDVIAGGRFTIAGGEVSAYFARYTFGTTGPVITTQPARLTACVAASAFFQVAATGASPTYQWRKDGVTIDPAANASATTPTLTMNAVRGVDAGTYDVIVTDSCGSATSNAAFLTVCVADFDDSAGTCDGGVTIEDLLIYLLVYHDGTARADIDDGTSTGTPDGGVTIDDLLYYLGRFEAGC